MANKFLRGIPITPYKECMIVSYYYTTCELFCKVMIIHVHTNSDQSFKQTHSKVAYSHTTAVEYFTINSLAAEVATYRVAVKKIVSRLRF